MPVPNGPKHHTASAEVDGKIYVLGGKLFENEVPNEINDALTRMTTCSMIPRQINGAQWIRCQLDEAGSQQNL